MAPRCFPPEPPAPTERTTPPEPAAATVFAGIEPEASTTCTGIEPVFDPPCFSNSAQSYTATCGPGLFGSSVTVVIAAGTYAADTYSQADAMALAAATEQALAALVCVFQNTAQTATAECEVGQVGGPYEVTVAAGAHESAVSQEAADALALADALAQVAVLAQGCHWENAEQTASCSGGSIGTPVVIAAGTFSSSISQANANALALAAANAALVCLFENAQQQFTASCPVGTVGSDVTATVLAGAYSSPVSQAAADALALAAAQDEAEAGLSCTIPALTVYLGDGTTVVGATLAFGSVLVSTGSNITLILKNTGSGILTLGTISVTGTGFSLVSGPGDTTLGPDETTSIVVRFEPATGG